MFKILYLTNEKTRKPILSITHKLKKNNKKASYVQN